MKTATTATQPKAPRYVVIAARLWKRDDGRTASVYGALPWTSEAEKPRWEMIQTGYTVRDQWLGTVGIGRVPWKDEDTAQAWVKTQDPALLP